MEDKIRRFIALILEENRRQNLVSRKAGEEELLKHVQDCSKILSWMDLSGAEIIDIGSGAGFPGIVLALLCPGSRLTLVESDLKKSGFLNLVKDQLGMDNVVIIRERAEALGRNPQYREHFDICSSRAVAAMRVVLEYGLPLVKTGGRLLLWKGSNYQQEIDEAVRALELLGGVLEKVYEYSLVGERDRAIVVVKKIHSTPAEYPRKIGVPAKKPL